MATRFAYDAMEPQSYADRIYTICSFDPGLVVARVKLFDARTDSEAIETGVRSTGAKFANSGNGIGSSLSSSPIANLDGGAEVRVENPRRRSLAAYLMIGMAVGQVLLVLAFSWIARSASPLAEDYRAKIEMPLWFAILPALTAVGVTVHLWFFRHVDRACPWVSLGWLILAANIGAFMLMMLIIS